MSPHSVSQGRHVIIIRQLPPAEFCGTQKNDKFSYVRNRWMKSRKKHVNKGGLVNKCNPLVPGMLCCTQCRSRDTWLSKGNVNTYRRPGLEERLSSKYVPSIPQITGVLEIAQCVQNTQSRQLSSRPGEL